MQSQCHFWGGVLGAFYTGSLYITLVNRCNTFTSNSCHNSAPQIETARALQACNLNDMLTSLQAKILLSKDDVEDFVACVNPDHGPTLEVVSTAAVRSSCNRATSCTNLFCNFVRRFLQTLLDFAACTRLLQAELT